MLGGGQPSATDAQVFKFIRGDELGTSPQRLHLERWRRHMQSFTEEQRSKFPVGPAFPNV